MCFSHLGPNFTPKHGTRCWKALTKAFAEENKRLDAVVKHAIVTFPAGIKPIKKLLFTQKRKKHVSI